MNFTREEKTALSLCISYRICELEKEIKIIKSIINSKNIDDKLRDSEKELLRISNDELKTLRNIFKKF